MPYALPKQAFKHERKLFEAMQDAGVCAGEKVGHRSGGAVPLRAA